MSELAFKDERYSDTPVPKIPRYSDTAVQQYIDTAIQQYSATAIQRYSDTATWRHSDIAIQQYRDTAIQRYNGVTTGTTVQWMFSFIGESASEFCDTRKMTFLPTLCTDQKQHNLCSVFSFSFLFLFLSRFFFNVKYKITWYLGIPYRIRSISSTRPFFPNSFLLYLHVYSKHT